MAREECADPLPEGLVGARLLPRLLPNAVALLVSVFTTGMETMWRGKRRGGGRERVRERRRGEGGEGKNGRGEEEGGESEGG